MIRLQFLGAAGTVTGSRYLLTGEHRRILVDCGLFQGPKELRLRNWETFPVDPKSIDAVFLTHAHIDHIGYLPRLVKMGFRGPIFATSPTTELAQIMLPDSARLQEEDAEFANKRGFTKHKPALPLYTENEAIQALQQFSSVSYEKQLPYSEEFKATWREAGHILGSARIDMETPAGSICFGGDLGRYDAPVLRDPQPLGESDYILCESTYGNRLHTEGPPAGRPLEDALMEVWRETERRQGILLIPSFAVGRAQELLYIVRGLELSKRIPALPIYVDSPMATSATTVFQRHPEVRDAEALRLTDHGEDIFQTRKLQFSRTRADSKRLNELKGPAVIISASGMATGGRILHHLALRLPHAENIVLFVGYQAEGTRGRSLVEGAAEVKIQGQYVPVRAKIMQMEGFSAHADYSEILRWLGTAQKPPKQLFLIHGEDDARAALAQRVAAELAWPVHCPHSLEEVTL